MDAYASEFSGLTTLSFESELSAFLELPANGGNAAPSDGGTATNNYNGVPYHQGYGQPGVRDVQCTGCAKYKLDLDRVSHEHQINFQLLKRKIINTDAVLRKYKEQKDYCDRLHAETEEFRRKMEQATRETDILSQQLSSSMANIKPLQEEKERLQAQLALKSSQIIELSDRLEGDKALKLQRSAQDEYNRNLEIEVTRLKKSNATLTTKIRCLDSKVKDLNAEKRCLMCSKHVVERRLDNLALALHEAEEMCQTYWDKLQQHDLATGKKRPTFVPNGFKSLVRRAVDKKNGVFTENMSESGAEEDGDDNISVHSVARNDDSDLDNISDVDSEGDSDVTSPKRDGPEKPNKDTELPSTSKSAVISQNHQSPNKQVENDKTTSPQLNKYSQMLPHSSAENSPQKITPKSKESQRDVEDTAGKLSHIKQAMPCSNNSLKPVGAAPRKDLETSLKLPETMKIVSEVHKEENSRHISDGSKEKSIVRSNSKIAPAADRTNLNQNSKNRNFDSLDDDSLSSLSSLSSSDDDDNDIDDFLNFGCTSDRKGQGVDLDTAFSFAEIQNLLSPLSVSPRPASSLSSRSVPPLSPHPVPLLPLQAVSEQSASTHPANSHGSSLSDEDSTDEGDTTADCLFASKSASPERHLPAQGDNRKKMYASEKSHINHAKASKSAPRDGGSQALIVSRSQSVGFTPATDDAGRICGLDVLDERISDSVAVLEDVNISEDISDATHVTDSCVLENVSNNATLVNTSNSGYSSNSAIVMDLSTSENICNITASTDGSMMDTCVEVYILKNVSPAALDKLDAQTEVGLGVTNTCDNKSVIKVTQASDMELALPQMHQSLNTHVLDLRPPLSQAHHSLDTQSLELKPSPPLFQAYHSLDTQSLDLKSSPPLLLAYHSLDTQSLDLKSSPPLSQAFYSLDTQSLDLKSSPPLSQAFYSLDTQSLDLKSSPPLSQAYHSLDTQSLDLKSSPPLSQAYHSLDTQSLDLKSSPPLSQAYQSLDTQSVNLKSASALPQTHVSSNMRSSNLKSSTLPETHKSLDTQSLDLKPSALPQTHQLLNIQAIGLKPSSPLSTNHHSLNSQAPNRESFTSLPPNDQSLDKQASGIRSSSAVPQIHPSLTEKATDIESSLTESKSLNTKASDMESSSTMPQSLNTKTSDIESSAVSQSLNTKTSDIESSAVSQSLNTKTSDIESSAMPQSLNTKASDIKSPSTVSQSLNTKASVMESLTVPQSLNTKAADMHSSTVPQSLYTNVCMESPTVPQSLSTKASDMESSTVSQSLNTKTSDMESSTVSQSLNTKASGMESSSAVSQLLITKASDMEPSSIVPQSLNTKVSDMESLLSMSQSFNRKASDMESSSVSQSLNTKTSGMESSSTVSQLLITKASDMESSSFVPQSLNTKASDMKSSTVPQSLNTEASDMESLLSLSQSLNSKASYMESLSVSQGHQLLNTKASGMVPSTVPKSLKRNTSGIRSLSTVPKSLKRKASDMESSPTQPLVHQLLNTETSGIKSPSAVCQKHHSLSTKASDIKPSSAIPQKLQSLSTKASDIKPSSVLAQRPQTLLLDVFDFFSLPPPLSPLPLSPCPHNQNEDMPLIKFNSAAPANVRKVTPCAQIERKSRIGNSSMSFQISEAKKLMAQRKAAVSIKPGAVTNGGERKRTATVADISPAEPTKKMKLADLSGLPSANAAVMYDLQQFLTAKDLDLKMTTETMLSRVEEGNTKAAWETLCEVTISYLEATHQDVLINLMSACEKKGIIDTVFIREDERRLLLLISAFCRLDENLDQQYLMGKIWTGIFNRDCSNQLVRLSYCRMFTSLCLKQGDLEQVRILLYNIAWCDYLDLIHPLMAIVGVWPRALARVYRSSESCIKNVLRFMLRDKCKADNSLLHKVTLVLQRVCQFDLDKKQESPETLLKSLLNTQLLDKFKDAINGSKPDQTFEAMKTIELLLVYQGSEWTEKNFIKSHLVSFTMRWENRRLDKSGPPDQFITCLLRIFRAVIAVQPLSASSVGTVLGTVFPRFLNSTAGDTDLRSTYIDALLELAPYSPDRCLDLLKKWQATQSNIPAETLSKLEQAQSLLCNEFPCNKVPPTKHKKGKKHKKPK